MIDGSGKPFAPTAERAHVNRLLAVACVAFFATGMAYSSIGPALPDLARKTGAGPLAVGGAVVAIQAGGLAGQIASAFLERLFGRRVALHVGMGLFLIATGSVAASSTLGALLAAAFAQGVGSGVFILLGNVIAAEASTGAGPLNLVNAMFGLGAIVSPALIAASITVTGTGLPALWAVPAVVLAGFLLLTLWAGAPASSVRPARSASAQPGERFSSGIRSPLLWTLCALVVLYIGIESSLGGWLSTLLQRSAGMTAAMGALTTSWFWLVHTSSRFGAAWASRRVSPQSMLRTAIWGCVAGSALLVACAVAASPLLGVVAAAVLGASVGPILPAALAIVRVAVPLDLSVSTAIVMGVGAFGGIASPWTLGALIVNVGALAGTLMFLAMSVGMALLLAATEAQMRGAAAPDLAARRRAG
jgi:fucose permease